MTPDITADMTNDTIPSTLTTALDHHHAGRLEEAEKLYQAILNLNPDQPSALHYKGVIALQTGNHQLAQQLISKALTIEPDDMGALVNLATAQTRLNNPSGALETYHRALSLNPEMPEIHYNLGILYQDEARYAESTDSYRRAIELRSSYVEAHYNLGVVLQALGRNDDAADCYETTVELDPGHAPALTNLGCVRQFQGRLNDAVALHRYALKLDPRFGEARSNLGRALQALGQLADAEHEYHEALKIDPDNAQCHVNLAMLLLLTQHDGNDRSDRGWREYEWRWKVSVLADHRLTQTTAPAWSGEPLDGKHLLIVGEQGIGEQVMFATMIPDVLTLGARITIDCDSRLVPVYNRSFPSVTVRALSDDGKPDHSEFDYHCAIGSLPRHLGTPMHRTGARTPLLQAGPDRVAELKSRYASLGTGPVIGISWRSESPTYFDQKNISLEQWSPIFQAASGATFVNLQYGDTKAELTHVQKALGIHIHSDTNIDALINLDDHAAQIAAVDQVISISNATVHLAGALGTHCTLMIGPVPLWHWFLDRSDSPWYDSVEIYRRSMDDDWTPVIKTIAQSLTPQ